LTNLWSEAHLQYFPGCLALAKATEASFVTHLFEGGVQFTADICRRDDELQFLLA
jgi:hypothetical protein